MKTLKVNQMENIQGGAPSSGGSRRGNGCGNAGSWMTIGAGVLGIIALANPVGGLVWGLSTAFGASFGITGIGCGIAELVGA